MRRSYSIASARSRLAEIIDDVEAGEEIEIMRRGKKVAVLVSPSRYARLSGQGTAFGEAYDAFMRKHDPETFGADPDFLDGARDRRPGRPVEL